ncbi:hypothetical protein B0H17DRAFT_1265523 [Mycena rosella]|uniref:Uncharacterized protein n=1 Tax=Mycena rosella TaxID=1033263 RepID=A0AAD7G4K5_MYCRO|nr:hypothetical protein B0H17DRAFT_1265523 [Mycena rosella]
MFIPARNKDVLAEKARIQMATHRSKIKQDSQAYQVHLEDTRRTKAAYRVNQPRDYEVDWAVYKQKKQQDLERRVADARFEGEAGCTRFEFDDSSVFYLVTSPQAKAPGPGAAPREWPRASPVVGAFAFTPTMRASPDGMRAVALASMTTRPTPKDQGDRNLRLPRLHRAPPKDNLSRKPPANRRHQSDPHHADCCVKKPCAIHGNRLGYSPESCAGSSHHYSSTCSPTLGPVQSAAGGRACAALHRLWKRRVHSALNPALAEYSNLYSSTGDATSSPLPTPVMPHVALATASPWPRVRSCRACAAQVEALGPTPDRYETASSRYDLAQQLHASLRQLAALEEEDAKDEDARLWGSFEDGAFIENALSVPVEIVEMRERCQGWQWQWQPPRLSLCQIDSISACLPKWPAAVSSKQVCGWSPAVPPASPVGHKSPQSRPRRKSDVASGVTSPSKLQNDLEGESALAPSPSNTMKCGPPRGAKKRVYLHMTVMAKHPNPSTRCPFNDNGDNTKESDQEDDEDEERDHEDEEEEEEEEDNDNDASYLWATQQHFGGTLNALPVGVDPPHDDLLHDIPPVGPPCDAPPVDPPRNALLADPPRDAPPANPPHDAPIAALFFSTVPRRCSNVSTRVMRLSSETKRLASLVSHSEMESNVEFAGENRDKPCIDRCWPSTSRLLYLPRAEGRKQTINLQCTGMGRSDDSRNEAEYGPSHGQHGERRDEDTGDGRAQGFQPGNGAEIRHDGDPISLVEKTHGVPPVTHQGRIGGGEAGDVGKICKGTGRDTWIVHFWRRVDLIFQDDSKLHANKMIKGLEGVQKQGVPCRPGNGLLKMSVLLTSGKPAPKCPEEFHITVPPVTMKRAGRELHNASAAWDGSATQLQHGSTVTSIPVRAGRNYLVRDLTWERLKVTATAILGERWDRLSIVKLVECRRNSKLENRIVELECIPDSQNLGAEVPCRMLQDIWNQAAERQRRKSVVWAEHSGTVKRFAICSGRREYGICTVDGSESGGQQDKGAEHHGGRPPPRTGGGREAWWDELDRVRKKSLDRVRKKSLDRVREKSMYENRCLMNECAGRILLSRGKGGRKGAEIEGQTSTKLQGIHSTRVLGAC